MAGDALLENSPSDGLSLKRSSRSSSPAASKRPNKKFKLETNGEAHLDESEEVGEDVDLEAFRKEAIHRQMLEYKREHARAADQAASFSLQLDALQASHDAVLTSWETLIAALCNMYPQAPAVVLPRLDAFSASNDFAAALEAASQSTLSLIASIVNQHQEGPSLSDLSLKCTQLTQDALASKRALDSTNKKLQKARADAEVQHEALLRAEKQLDRAKSSTVAKLNFKGKEPESQQVSPAVSKAPTPPALSFQPDEALDATMQPEPKVEYAMLVDSTELDELRHLVSSRMSEIDGFIHERIALLQEIDQLRLQLAHIPPEIILESPAYKSLQAQYKALSEDADSALIELATARTENDGMREMQSTWRETVFKEAATQVDELSKKIVAKDADLARIRQQREEARADALELRARETEKLRSVDAVRTMANSKEDRLLAYKSEVTRLRMLVAAGQGDMENVDLEGTSDLRGQLAGLQKEHDLAQTLVIALRDQLKAYGTTSGTAEAPTIIKSETAARMELAEIQQQLDDHKALYGNSTDVDVNDLSARLQAKAEQIKVLEATLKAQELSSSMLIGEVERLSTAWQTLDTQNRDKVLNLIAYEERLNKLLTEKGKADNRYFAAMRAKDQLAGENSLLQKASEKQLKAIEILTEARTALVNQITALEKEVSLQVEAKNTYKRKFEKRQAEMDNLKLSNSDLTQQIADLESTLQDRTSSLELEASGKRRLEEQVGRLERQVEKYAVKEAEAASAPRVKVNGTGNAQVEELEKFNADLTKMLKCTSCQIRFKSHVITRCYHLCAFCQYKGNSFTNFGKVCHECIEQRLTLRQRKCPTCQMAFGAADVAQVYF